MIKIAYPWVFWLLLGLPLFGLLAWQKGRGATLRLRQLVAQRLHFSLVGQVPTQRLRLALIFGGLGLAIVALTRPQWGEIKEQRKGWGRDVIIAVDVSRSMLATDLPPSRLKRAKLAAEDLVRQLPGDRIGLVAFAGSSFLQAPVTSDHAAILAAIQELDPDLIPLPGTNISDALRCVVDAFDHAEGGQRALILISDGEDLEADGLAVAKELAGQVRIFTVGVGTPEGAILQVPSPKGGMEYIRDADGNVVLSHLDESRMKELAAAGGGFYTRLHAGPAEMRHIVQDGIQFMEEHEVQQEGKVRAVERYQWPLGVALLLFGVGLVLGEKPRRKMTVLGGVVGGALSVFLVLIPAEVSAATARELYDAGDYPGSMEAFGAELSRGTGSPARAYNLGTAAYKSGKWAEAIEAFGGALASPDPVLKSKAEYNLANTLVQQARQGRRGMDAKAMEQAIAHYEAALRQDPKLEDASFNRDAVRRMLEKKEQQKQKDDKKDKKDSKEKDDDKDKEKDKDQEKKDSKADQSGDGKDDKDSKSEEEKDSKDGKEGKDQKGKPSKGDQGKDGKDGKEPQSGEGKDDKKEPGAEPKEEKTADSKPRGELKNNPVEGGKQREGKEQSGREGQAQAGDGKLSREQAAALIEALRSEDRRVQLWSPDAKQQQQARTRDGRTW